MNAAQKQERKTNAVPRAVSAKEHFVSSAVLPSCTAMPPSAPPSKRQLLARSTLAMTLTAAVMPWPVTGMRPTTDSDEVTT
jgi:hypothetical protein